MEEGWDKYPTTLTNHPTCTTTEHNREFNIAGYCIFIFSNILQNTSNTLLAVDIPHHSNQSVSAGKTLCHQCFQAPPAGRFQKSTCHFFSWLKTLWWTHVIEYFLLGIWPISLFAFMQYTGAKPEKVNQNIPLRSYAWLPGFLSKTRPNCYSKLSQR